MENPTEIQNHLKKIMASIGAFLWVKGLLNMRKRIS